MTLQPFQSLPTKTTTAHARPAFTLIELLVVMTIVVIMATLSIPAIKTLTNGNSQKQATNLITTLIAAARANAIQGHTQAGIVIFEDPSAKNQSSVQLIVQSAFTSTTNSGANTYFIRAQRTVAQRLPVGIKIATFNDAVATQFFTSDATGSVGPRIILFDATGQLIFHNNLLSDPILTDAAATAWKMNTTTPGVSKPALLIYDGNAAQAAKDANVINSDATLYTWLQQHADLININIYTGNIIR